MKQVFISIIIFSTSLLYSCQEVIEIDLNSSNPVVVIDGEISVGQPAQVNLTYTSDYFTTEEQAHIQDAELTLISSNGETEVLMHMGDGSYMGSSVLGEANTTYELQIDMEGISISGTSTIMADFALIGINQIESVVNRPGLPGSDPADSIAYNLELTFTDSETQENIYMMQILQNGEVGEFGYLFVDDQLYGSNGTVVYNPMMYQFAKGDTAHIRISSLDEEAYEFYNQLSDVAGSSGMRAMMSSGTPYNPISNMGDEVMGYFAAWAVVDTTIIVQ